MTIRRWKPRVETYTSQDQGVVCFPCLGHPVKDGKVVLYDDYCEAINAKDKRIAELEAENAKLRHIGGNQTTPEPEEQPEQVGRFVPIDKPDHMKIHLNEGDSATVRRTKDGITIEIKEAKSQ